jgi:hypothetical protein
MKVQSSNCPIRKLPAELIEDFAKAQFEKILKSKDILKLLSEKTGYPPRIILDIFYLELLGECYQSRIYKNGSFAY